MATPLGVTLFYLPIVTLGIF
ncbi:hypothetical protein LINPERHAP1_LOCUS16780 [Linum perenne]